MQLTEQHVIRRDDPRYQHIDAAAFASKNLWNAANSLVRQSFIFQGVYLNNNAVFHLITEESYTSRASFLDRDEIPIYDPARTEEPRFSGRRDGR